MGGEDEGEESNEEGWSGGGREGIEGGGKGGVGREGLEREQTASMIEEPRPEAERRRFESKSVSAHSMREGADERTKGAGGREGFVDEDCASNG